MNPWWLLIILSVFFIGLTKSGFGAGLGLLTVPLIVIALSHIPSRGAEAAIGFMLPLLILGDLLAVYQYRRLFSMNIVRHLLPGTFVGVIIGGAMLWFFHQQPPRLLGAIIRIEIGIESIGLVSLHWWRQYRGVQSHLVREPLRSHLTGGFAAVSSTLANAAWPIISMYLLPLGLDRQLFVGTSAIYFFLLNTAKLPSYYVAHQFDHAELSFTLKFAPLVVIGALFGLWVNRRLSDAVFARIVYVVTFLLGWYVLFDGARMLVK